MNIEGPGLYARGDGDVADRDGVDAARHEQIERHTPQPSSSCRTIPHRIS
jgi:hypothetical protein